MPSVGMQEHPPDQADHHRVHQQRAEQDGVVDVLAALDVVQHQRDREADQELEQHDRHDERSVTHSGVAELGVATARAT